ncbi:MAG: uncharacterized protein JWM44_3843 [Bacilli bacterium]|nr:uncharacterized protein [Bacilli bacterium]
MMKNRKWLKKSFLTVVTMVFLLVGATSAFANPIINESTYAPYGYSITQTYFNYDNYGYMEAGPPMDSWNFTNDSNTSHTITFSVDTAGASGGFTINDRTTGTGGVLSAGSITPGTHTYSLTLIAYHNYTVYVQPTGSKPYYYHFTLS